MAERRTSMPNPSLSPPPPMEPATASTRRRRRQQLPSSSSPSSSRAIPMSASSFSLSASSDLSFPFPSPVSSPFHNHFFLSPLRTSAVPFSWEHLPGIPKTPARQQAARTSGKSKMALLLPLPLPPSLLSTKVGVADEYFIVLDDAKARRRRQRKQRQPALAATLTDWLAMLSLYKSCTRSCDCLASNDRSPPAPANAYRQIH